MTVPKRFGILRIVAGLIKVFAWIVLILSIIVGIVVALTSMTSIWQTVGSEPAQLPLIGGILDLFVSFGGGIVVGILSALGGVLYFLLLYAAAELISMQLAVEENTRLTAALLLRMHQESQPEPRAATPATAYAAPTSYSASGYNPGYSSEPFEGGN